MKKQFNKITAAFVLFALLFTAYPQSVLAAPKLAAPAITAVELLSSSSLAVTWKPAKSATGYVLYRAYTANGSYRKIGATSNTTLTDKKVLPKKTYFYKVRAYQKVNSKTIFSAYGKTVDVYTSTARPALSSITSKAISVNAVSLSWKYAPAASAFQIQVSTKPATEFKSKNVGKRLYQGLYLGNYTSLQEKTKYYIRVRPYTKKSGVTFYGLPSAAKSATSKAAPIVTPDPTPPTPDPSPAPNTNDEVVNEIARLTNLERTKAGLEPLVMDEKMMKAAKKRAEELLVDFSHNRPNGEGYWTVFAEFGIQLWQQGEIAIRCYPAPTSAVLGWMNSEGHRNILMKPDIKYHGVAYMLHDEQWYCVQLFAKDYAVIP